MIIGIECLSHHDVADGVVFANFLNVFQNLTSLKLKLHSKGRIGCGNDQC